MPGAGRPQDSSPRSLFRIRSSCTSFKQKYYDPLDCILEFAVASSSQLRIDVGSWYAPITFSLWANGALHTVCVDPCLILHMRAPLRQWSAMRCNTRGLLGYFGAGTITAAIAIHGRIAIWLRMLSLRYALKHLLEIADRCL